MNIIDPSKFAVGKYTVSPLTRRTDAGTFAPSVSIRSGRGRGTHDRVFRFIARFESRDDAIRYAKDQALAWIGRPMLQTQP